MRKFTITESELRKIVRKTILEQENGEMKEVQEKPRCVPENVVPLDEIVGTADEYVEDGSADGNTNY